MRIALVSQEYPPETARGGIGTQTYAKAQGLAALGHEVFVVSLSVDDDRHEYRDGAVNVIRIPRSDGSSDMPTREAWWLIYSGVVANAIRTLDARRPLDVVDFPEYGAEGFTWLRGRTTDDRVTAVVQLHGPLAMLAETIGWPARDSQFYRTGTFMEGECVRLADAVYSSSACSADWCARSYGIPRQAIEILHTGIDVEHFAPGRVPKRERPTIVFVGKITRSKGVDALVDAAVRLAGEIPDLSIRLIGRGDKHEESELLQWIAQRAKSADRPDLVDVVGYVHRTELPDHLSSADVFAAPSKYEGGPGFVYLEAMACGLPIVACAGSGVAEIVRSGETGMLVPPDDREALVDTLRTLLRQPALRARMGEQARQYVVEHADARQCLKRLDAFYRSAMAKARSSVGAGRASEVRS